MRPDAAGTGKRGSMLLLEPYFVSRRTITSVIAALDLADIHEASSLDAAHKLMNLRAFDFVIIALSDDNRELALIHDLRAGKTRSAAGAKVAVICGQPLPDAMAQMRDLQVARMILRPFKVKVIIETASQFIAAQEVPA